MLNINILDSIKIKLLIIKVWFFIICSLIKKDIAYMLLDNAAKSKKFYIIY